MKTLLLVGLTAVAAMANAQSFSSFHPINGMHGITITEDSGNPLGFTVAMDPDAADNYLTVGATNYEVSNIFGFYALNENSFTSASASDQNDWSFSGGAGQVAGWRGNPAHTAILPGNSLDFVFDSLSPKEGTWGLHVSFADATPTGWGGGNTFFVNVPQAVPEPSSLLCLAGAPLALLFKRRKK